MRGTAGSDRLESSVPPSTLVASLPCVNILFNSVVSSDAFFGSVDLTDFYLESPLATSQLIKIYTNLFSPEVLSRLSLLPFTKQDKAGKNYITFRIDKTMYGLKEAGKLFNLLLRVVEGGWRLWCSKAVGGRGVDRGGGSVGNAGRTEAGKESGYVSRIRDGEGAGRAVVVEREPKNLVAIGWALAWYRVERQETRKAKSEGWWYLAPKSSTTKTKVIEREAWRKRPGVWVW